ncbi:MAG: UDP-N-acetylmuramate dehydrogenase, partial [Thermoanaerobaculia bacterium]
RRGPAPAGPARPEARAAPSVEPPARRHLAVGPDENHRARRVRQAEHQHLRKHRADLPGREVDHRHHLPADQRGGRVVGGDPGRGAPLAQVARRAAKAGLGGLEALSGFPSTVGGAVFMNAGCYGVEIRDVLRSARLVGRDGARRRVTTVELEPAYRSTNLKRSGEIVTRALFELAPGEPAALLARIDELNARRWQSLPSGVANAGSVFRNPPGDYAGRLIDACGLKGTRAGAAEISPRHANVIVNTGGATARDVLTLMRRMRDEVAERFGVRLVPELMLLGDLVHDLDEAR